MANIPKEFENAAAVTIAKAKALAAKLAKALGLDTGGAAMGSFLAAFENMPDAVDQLSLALTKVAPPINDAVAAVRRLKSEFSLMGGGAVKSLTVGAQTAGRKGIESAKARAGRRNQENNAPRFKNLISALKMDAQPKRAGGNGTQKKQLTQAERTTAAVEDIAGNQVTIGAWA